MKIQSLLEGLIKLLPLNEPLFDFSVDVIGEEKRDWFEIVQIQRVATSNKISLKVKRINQTQFP